MAGDVKQCFACKKLLPLSCYWKDRRRDDGLQIMCKECLKRYFREHRWARVKQSPDYQAGHRRRQKKYRAEHPEIANAHQKAQAKKATLKKSACEQCGASDCALHMHHPDHGKPLEVVTLCVPCHEAVHHAR